MKGTAEDMPSLTEGVARLVLETYEALHSVGKPAVRSNGIPEWTILAGVVVQRQGEPQLRLLLISDLSLCCLSVATGVKCLSHDKVVQAKGLALHDSHAEILAIRGVNRFVPSPDAGS
jgi:tRNA-specific adenosine deaminase 1